MIHTVGPDHLQFWRGDDFEISEFEITNPRTRRPESGKIRFYAKWGDENGEYVGIEPYHLDSLHAVNLAAVGINNPGQAHPSVYGPNSPIPSSATFWMEGVRPGKITLEWRYRKGAEDIRFEQTFLVATEQSKEKWFEELAYMIRLQTDDDPIGQTPMMFAPTRPSAVMPNLVRTWGGDVDVRNEIENAGSYFRKIGEMSEYYDFYEQCWLQNKALDWAGLARRVGNQVVAGISDFEYFLTGAGVVTFLWPDPVLR